MEPSELLKKLSSLVDEKKEQKGSWVAPVVIFSVSVFAIFVFAWISGKNAKEIANLRHEKNKREVEKENLNLTMHRELDERRVLDLAIKIDNNKTELENIEKRIEVASKVHKENLKNINSITGWKDI